jgi:hypothetical protein
MTAQGVWKVIVRCVHSKRMDLTTTACSALAQFSRCPANHAAMIAAGASASMLSVFNLYASIDRNSPDRERVSEAMRQAGNYFFFSRQDPDLLAFLLQSEGLVATIISKILPTQGQSLLQLLHNPYKPVEGTPTIENLMFVVSNALSLLSSVCHADPTRIQEAVSLDVWASVIEVLDTGDPFPPLQLNGAGLFLCLHVHSPVSSISSLHPPCILHASDSSSAHPVPCPLSSTPPVFPLYAFDSSSAHCLPNFTSSIHPLTLSDAASSHDLEISSSTSNCDTYYCCVGAP